MLLKSNLVVWRVVVVCRSAVSGASTEMLDIRSGPASEVGEVVKGSDVVVVRIHSGNSLPYTKEVGPNIEDHW